MRIFDEGMSRAAIRVQPWTTSNHRSPGKYYDFRKCPELIRTNLEEFSPYDTFDGVRNFYSLLEWLNGAESPFETNDSRLTNHMKVNDQRDLAEKDFVSLVEFCFFFRDLRLNLVDESAQWHLLWNSHLIDEDGFQIKPNETCRRYIDSLLRIVKRSSGEKWPQIVGLSTAPLLYENAPVAPHQKYGTEFVVRAWLWGDTELEIFNGLTNVVSILRPAISKGLNGLGQT